MMVTFSPNSNEGIPGSHHKAQGTENRIEHQESNKIIPKQYQPKQLKTFDSALLEEFNQKYNTLFFQQLEKVITTNTIKLKLTECMLASIITQRDW